MCVCCCGVVVVVFLCVCVRETETDTERRSPFLSSLRKFQENLTIVTYCGVTLFSFILNKFACFLDFIHC